jgi:methyl-accepting chemotaxis protein
MSIKTQIKWYCILFIALVLALAGYQSIAAYKVLSLNKAFSQADFLSASDCLELLRIQAQVKENVRRWQTQGDESASTKLKESTEEFAADLNRLRSEAVLGKPREETNRLEQFWGQFNSDLATAKPAPAGGESSDIASAIDEDLSRLENQVQTVYQASLESLASRVETSNRSSQALARNSWLLAAGAVLIGLLSSFWHYRSISTPLTQLEEGTQSIAQGKFFVRLDTSRQDEFSRIAKNINDLTQSLRESSITPKPPERT